MGKVIKMQEASAKMGLIGGSWAFVWSILGLVMSGGESGYFIFYLILVCVAVVGILGEY